jgi:hypothetical protein
MEKISSIECEGGSKDEIINVGNRQRLIEWSSRRKADIDTQISQDSIS